jgi:hypothetical protein
MSDPIRSSESRNSKQTFPCQTTEQEKTITAREARYKHVKLSAVCDVLFRTLFVYKAAPGRQSVCPRNNNDSE